MWALVPIKAFDSAKQRLAGFLSAAERAGLARAMAEDVLSAVAGHASLARVVVCGSGIEARAIAGAHGVDYISEAELGFSGDDPGPHASVNSGPNSRVNLVINAVTQHLAAQGAGDLVVVPGDVPLLASEDLEFFLRLHRGGGGASVTISPDRCGAGTNLIAWRPISQFVVQFGSPSYERHCNQAREIRACLQICGLDATALDIDKPADLKALAFDSPLHRAPATRSYLRSHGLYNRLAAMPTAQVETMS